MKVLVVGASGLVGRAVVERLSDEGHDVVGFTRGRPDPAYESAAECLGDVTLPNLGLTAAEADELREGLTHVVSVFGSVSWEAGPSSAFELHEGGTDKLLRFAATCPQLERFVHVSSLLVLGRAQGPVGNRHLDVGQRFRNWYEYGKFLAERRVREERDVPVRTVRLGPVLGGESTVRGAARHGLLASLPTLLRGWPVPLSRSGAFPCYPADAESAAEVVVRALEPPGGPTWTYFDPAMPTLAGVLAALCSAWGVVPRLVDAGALRGPLALASRRLGFSDALLAYSEPWFELEANVLDALPFPAPQAPVGYVEDTGRALREAAVELV